MDEEKWEPVAHVIIHAPSLSSQFTCCATEPSASNVPNPALEGNT